MRLLRGFGQERRFSLGLWLAAGLCVLHLSNPANAQSQCTDPSLDRLKHPPGMRTQPLGQMGRVDKVGVGRVPLILIPGAAFGGGIWHDFMQRNRERYTMYAVTPAGYGGTDPPPWPEAGDFSKCEWTDGLCRAIVKLIDSEKLDRPLIVGHHMLGDHYALRIALDHPDKTCGVVVIAGMPSMAFGAWGENEKGKPVKTASLEQRRKLVEQMWAPFYKTVTDQMWKAGSFQARLFCRDGARATKLFEQQVSVPVPTQVCYFLEYQTTDVEPALRNLAVPLLAVLPRREWTLDAALDAFRESNELMYGDRDLARAAWTQNLTMIWGDPQEGVRWMNDWGFRWERLRGVVPDMTVSYVDDTGIFVMEDRPDALDREIHAFAQRVRKRDANPPPQR